MRNIVLISHGELAYGMHSVVKMIAGDRREVYSICLKQDMDAGAFMNECRKLFSSFGKDAQVILLTDILSGSPITNALAVLEEEHHLKDTIVIGGMNMPMVLDAIFKKDQIEDLKNLEEELIQQGRSGIDGLKK